MKRRGDRRKEFNKVPAPFPTAAATEGSSSSSLIGENQAGLTSSRDCTSVEIMGCDSDGCAAASEGPLQLPQQQKQHSARDARRTARRRRHHQQQPSWSLGALLVVLVQLIRTTNSQVGDTFCGCTPSSYTMTLDFALTCADTSISLSSPGILDVTCSINPALMGNPTEAYAFQIQVLELDQNFQVLKQDTFSDTINNGGTFTYDSAISEPTADPEKVPGSIEIGIMAQDVTMTRLFQMWTISFSNSCDIYPVITPDMQVGWTVIVRRVIVGKC